MSTLDVLDCELIWLEGACYRKFKQVESLQQNENPTVTRDRSAGSGFENLPSIGSGFENVPSTGSGFGKMTSAGSGFGNTTSASMNNRHSATVVDSPYVDELLYPEDDMLQDYVINKSTDGQFITKVHVPKDFHGVIVGKGAKQRNRLESETRTRIFIPKPHDRDEFITVSGTNHDDVASAFQRISILTRHARMRSEFTHFLSIPLNIDAIQRNLEEFKTKVFLAAEGSRGLDESLFLDPRKVHITIGTLALLCNHDKDLARETLASCKDIFENVLEKEPLYIRVSGLEIMNDDVSEVDILYAKIQSFRRRKDNEEKRNTNDDRLQRLVDEVAARFRRAGLLLERYTRENVKLHATIMNTKYRTDKFAVEKPDGAVSKHPRESFNAATIMKVFSDYNFGKIIAKKIEISVRHLKHGNSEGYYNSLSTLELPFYK